MATRRHIPWLYVVLVCTGGLFFLGNIMLVYQVEERHRPVERQTDYECMYAFQTQLNQFQSVWYAAKVPILSSIIPHRGGIKAVFIMKHIESELYESWYRSRWYCAAAPSSETAAATLIGKDPHNHTLIVECTAAAHFPSSLHVVLEGNTTTATHEYKIPMMPCPSSWQMQPATLSACTMLQGLDALQRVHEWIAYHRVIGFEHFYIYINDDDEAIYSYLKRRVRRRHAPSHLDNSVHWIPFQDTLNQPFFVQQAMQNDCIHRGMQKSNWIALFDVDEYFQLLAQPQQQQQSAQPLLLTRFLDPYSSSSSSSSSSLSSSSARQLIIGGIQVKNCFFGRNPIVPVHDNTSRLVLDRFIYRAPHCIRTGREKVIVQPRHVQYFSVHTITLGQPMHVADPITQLRLNHYRRPDKGVWGQYKKKAWPFLVRDASMRAFIQPMQAFLVLDHHEEEHDDEPVRTS